MNKKETNELFLDELDYYDKKDFLDSLGHLFRIIGGEGMEEIMPTELKQVKKNLLKYFDTLLLSEEEYVNEVFGVFKRLPVIERKQSYVWIVLPSGDVISTNRKHDTLREALPFKVSPWTASAKAQAKYDKLVKKYENSSAVDMAEIKENEKFAKETTVTPRDVKPYSLFLYWQLRQAEGKKMLKPTYTGLPLSKLLQEEDAASAAYREYNGKMHEESGNRYKTDAMSKQLFAMLCNQERASKDYYETWVKYQQSTRECYDARIKLFADEYIIKEGQEEKFRQTFNTALAEYITLRDRINKKKQYWRPLKWTKSYFISIVFYHTRGRILHDLENYFYTDKEVLEYTPQVRTIQKAIDDLLDMLRPVSKEDIESFISGVDVDIPSIAKEYLYYMRAVERPAQEEVA